MSGVIKRINGPVVITKGASGLRINEACEVGKLKLTGEVIGLEGDEATLQVYESTTGLQTGEAVNGTGKPLSVVLCPGIIGNTFDGIQRPLEEVYRKSGPFINRGSSMEGFLPDDLWETKILVKPGDEVFEGKIIAAVKETKLIEHRVMISPGFLGNECIRAVIASVEEDGHYRVDEPLVQVNLEHANGTVTKAPVTMRQEWPVRKPRPLKERLAISEPLITGQRVIDTFFPMGKGGAAAIPGSFGTGKTMTQHQLAKWANADIIVYIGCGERGNEMTEVLNDFPKLIDPITNRPLMERTILIANTSNMPVAAREASIYTGITLAEYYRDMGYDVAVMADSTSRWAEALREISGRLEEMPAEEGFPAYLSSRLSDFYERAGNVITLNGKQGSVSIIGAISPQGGDFSEPVTQNTKRYIRCFWGLDRQLAYSRHYPAINWLSSYSEYFDQLKPWYDKNCGKDFTMLREKMLDLLREESKLNDIVKLVGEDVLADEQKLILRTGKIIRVGFLQQAAFHKTDTFVPLKKQLLMMRTILNFYVKALDAVKNGKILEEIEKTGIMNKVIEMKYDIGNEDFSQFEILNDEIGEVL